MLRKMTAAIMCCMLMFIQVAGSSCKAEDAFDAVLAQGLKLATLPEEPPAIIQLYQCQVLASFLQPGMEIREVQSYMERENLQPSQIIQVGSGEKMITTVFFSPYYRIEMRGETVKSMAFQIATSEQSEPTVTIPLSIQYTIHTIVNESVATNFILVQPSRTKEEIYAYIQQGITEVRKAKHHDLSLVTRLVPEMMQYALFASVLYPGMPIEDVVAYAQEIPVLASSEQVVDENDITWNWSSVMRGKMSFYCEFEKGCLTHAGFWVDEVSVMNALLPMNQHTFLYDYEIISGIVGYTYCPTTYVELTETWISQED